MAREGASRRAAAGAEGAGGRGDATGTGTSKGVAGEGDAGGQGDRAHPLAAVSRAPVRLRELIPSPGEGCLLGFPPREGAGGRRASRDTIAAPLVASRVDRGWEPRTASTNMYCQTFFLSPLILTGTWYRVPVRAP